MAKPKKKASVKTQRRTPAFTNVLGMNDAAGAMVDVLLREGRKSVKNLHTGLDAEMFGSSLWGMLDQLMLVGEDGDEVIENFITDLAGRAETNKVASTFLHALASVSPEPHRRQLADALQRVESEPPWVNEIGTATARRAIMMAEFDFDDVRAVIVEFDHPSQPHVLHVLIDNNMGGIVRDAFVQPDALQTAENMFREAAEADAIHDLDLDKAKAMLVAAFEATDQQFQPPVEETYVETHALALARIRTMPGDGVVEETRLSEEECTTLVSQFLESTPVKDAASNVPRDRVEYLAGQILWFSNDHVAGTPLRFSPEMVAMFCLDWIPRKVMLADDDLAHVPDVLKAWCAFVNERRGLDADVTNLTWECIDEISDEMEEAGNTASWGPAKLVMSALQEKGIDLTDQKAVNEFITQVNANGGIDTLQPSTRASSVYRLKVTIKGIRPPIWRRIEISSAETLATLHRTIQIAFGWMDSHLHEFTIAGSRYGDPGMIDGSIDECDVTIGDVAESGDTFSYTYDFGDDWEHSIKVEKVTESVGAAVKPKCIGGKRACPPEDCGGPWGYGELLDILADPNHAEYEERLEWLGESFDPEAFVVRIG
jgi:hypothetical protein